MDNKRKGSNPPGSSSGSGHFEWDKPAPRDTFTFADDDDEDGPLPAPPDFDGQAGGVPELLDGEEAIIDEAEPIDDPELLDSALVTPMRANHATPPPIPAPVPTGPSQRGFIDDGEIALPPRISRHVQNFPFRQVRAEDDPSAEEHLDDEHSPDAAGWRSAALHDDDDVVDDEPEELDAGDAEMVEEDDEPPPPPAARFTPASGDPALRFNDDDDDAPPLRPAPQREDRAPFDRADDPPLERAPSPTVTGSRWSFADLDNQPSASTSFASTSSASTSSAALSSSQFNARSGVIDDDEPVPAARFGAPTSALADDDHDPSRMFDGDDRSAETVADGSVEAVDDTGLYGAPRENAPTGMFVRDDLDRQPPRPAARSPMAALPSDDELQLPYDDDAAPPPAPPAAFIDDDDDEAGTAMFSATRVRAVAEASQTLSLGTDDDETSGWVHPRPPQPSAAIAVATDLDDDDDAAWEPPARSVAAPIVQATPQRVPTNPPLSPIGAPVPAAPAPIITRITQEDAEASGIGGWIATRPGASIASGAIPVAEFGDDDDWPAPTAEMSRGPAARAGNPPSRILAEALDASAAIAVTAATLEQQDPPPDAAVSDRRPRDDDDDDDEWEPQSAVADLAPVPDDLGEPFPLDLWSDPDELNGRELGGYRLERPLSRGMTTRVYLGESVHPRDDAEDGGAPRRVAVRVLGPMYSPAEPRARQFLFEAQQLLKLRSEHIVEVLAAGTTHDHLTYYVMEYLEGETLAGSLRAEGPMAWADVAAFANQICDAMIVAADRGIVHNDLNATTCMRLHAESTRSRPEGEPPRDVIKLLGVGVTPLVSVYRSVEGTWALSQGTPPGAAEFMAPEIAGGGRPDARTAVYAVGVLMYELATGRPPFRGDSFIAVLKKQMYEEPTSPRMVVPEQEIAEVFETVVLRALAKAPGDRFADLRALDEALLAARAREGELRRVTQILALDPAFWDEDGSRRIKQQGSQPQRSADPTPLATFAADLKASQPELAAAVFKRPESSRSGAREPSVALHLAHLAAPIVAPALPPISQAQAQPVIVLARPTPASSSGNLFRNISVGIVVASLLTIAALWLSDRGRTNNRKASEVAADVNKRPTSSKSKTRPPREPKVRNDAPVVPPPSSMPETVLAPPPEPEAPIVKQLPPEPAPTVVQAPPPEPEPEPIKPTVVPEPVKQPEPEPEPEPEPVKPTPEPVKPTPEPVKPTPEPVKPTPVKKTPKPILDPNDDRPESITSGRLQAKLKSMEPRVATRCKSKAGVPDPRGLAVTVRVVVDVKGEVKATATGNWANTPMGQCIEEVLEAIRFNETRSGGGRSHTFKF